MSLEDLRTYYNYLFPF
jgi:DNA primase small subunit